MSDGILSGSAIARAVTDGDIAIDGYEPKHINPASYDLTLGDNVVVYERVTQFWADPHPNEPRSPSSQRFREDDGTCIEPWKGLDANRVFLDSKKANPTRSFKIGPDGWVIKPGVGYLMHTRERIKTDKFEPIVDGKSSIGRLFVVVHVTAGYGEPGFDGQYTLEVVALVHPVKLYAGMRIAQIRFQTISGEIDLYDGHYKGDTAKGAVASHSYEQFDNPTADR